MKLTERGLLILALLVMTISIVGMGAGLILIFSVFLGSYWAALAAACVFVCLGCIASIISDWILLKSLAGACVFVCLGCIASIISDWILLKY